MRHAMLRRWVATVAGLLVALCVANAWADEPEQNLVRSVALNRLGVDEAVGLIRSVCLQARVDCTITPIPEPNGAAGARVRRHINVTAPSSVLERVDTLFRDKDGAQPTRVFRIALVRAANSDLGSSDSIPPALAATLDEVREVLHFKFFRVVSTVLLSATGEAQLIGTAIDRDSPGDYSIAMNVAGALNLTEGVNVREFELKRGDRKLMNTQFYVQFGKPLVVGVSAYPSRGEALFVVITAAEEPEP